MQLDQQIAALLQDRAARLADLLGDPALRADLEARAAPRASRLAGALAGDDTAEMIADLYALAHGDSDPAPEWWQTPLGRACARSIGTPDAEAVMPSVAAAMLGVGERRVYQLRDSGKLDRHPDGGVTRASVLARIARA